MTIKESVMQGRIPAGFGIFDAHAHIGEGEYANIFLYNLPIAQSLSLSRKVGISKMAVTSLRSLAGDTIAGNDRLFEIVAGHPDMLYGYVHFNPSTGKAGIDCIEKYKGHPSFIGVKIHPREDQAPLSEGCYDQLWPYCEEHGIIILVHTWQTEFNNDPAHFWPILRRFPNLKLLLGHMGGTRKGVLESCALAAAFKNVYLDLNGSLYSQTWPEVLAHEAGTEKLIFSTDQTFNDPRIILGRVLLSELEDETKRNILRFNFERMAGRALI